MRYIASFVFVIGLFITLPQVTNADFTTTDFITTWDTTKSGTSASNQITIPGTGSGYSYSIYWESLSSSTATGTIATSTSASQTITFPEPGEYKVAIKGTYPRIYFNNGGDKLKILTVEQWGNNSWTSMDSAFYGCTNLTVPATDAPDLSGVTNMGQMFFLATSFNQSIDHWDISNVTSLYRTFRNATSFNQPLNSWNTSNVTSLIETFTSASSFNQPLNNWNVSNVTSMYALFLSTSFNQPLDNWNVSNVTDMFRLFVCTPFNQSLNSWDVSKVTTMVQMFGCWSSNPGASFNQPLNNWNTASVTSMVMMFANNSAFDQNLSSWNMTSVVTVGSWWSDLGLDNMFLNTTLSQSNLNSTLQGWATQSLHSNVPFYLGLKTYSSTGQTALDTLRNTYNWTITEQYKATYEAGDDYTLSGTTTQSPINLNGTTTAIEVIPNNRCTFINWSDNNTTNPRTDTLTDNLTVSVNVECVSPSSSNSATSRYNKLLEFGNTTEAEALKAKYLTTNTPTITEVIKNLNTLTTNPIITNNPETRQQLITLLTKLVQILEKMRGE